MAVVLSNRTNTVSKAQSVVGLRDERSNYKLSFVSELEIPMKYPSEIVKQAVRCMGLHLRGEI